MKNLIIISLLFVFALGQNSNAQSASTFINELNYLVSDPADAGLEIAGQAGTNLAGWSIVGYTLDGTVEYIEYIEDGTIPNQQNGYGTFWYDVEQNSSGGGLALVNAGGNVVQFLSYGTINFAQVIIHAVDGPADGLTSQYIGTQILPQNSLQLLGTGLTYSNFWWSLPFGVTEGLVNVGQLFGLPPLFTVDTNNGQNTVNPYDEPYDNEREINFAQEGFDAVIFPNPTAGPVKIRMKGDVTETVEVRLFDRMGRMVKYAEIQVGSVPFDMSDLMPGNYIMKIKTANQYLTKTVIKI